MSDLLLSLFPIALLVHLMTRRRPLPAHLALPLVAAVFYLIRMLWFHTGPALLHASVIAGLLDAWKPILIVGSAVLLFRTMEHSGAMSTIRSWLQSITPNEVAQLMLIGWAFSFMIEGASGFGTPSALAAPILVGLGFQPVRVAALCLIMNSVPVSFGAFGTPTWFGLSEVDPALSLEELRAIGANVAILHSVAALVIPVLALRLVVSWREIGRNLVFVYLSVLSCVLPYLLLALYAPGRSSFELPSIVGGMIGVLTSACLARAGIGLARTGEAPSRAAATRLGARRLVAASFPLWGAVLLLVLTRARFLGLGSWLKASSPSMELSLGGLGTFHASPSLHVGLRGILGTELSWSHPLLFIPSLIPFALSALLCFALFRMSRASMRRSLGDALHQMRRPAIALMGALVFVKLLMMGGESSSAQIIGRSLADGVGGHWRAAASYLGALGAFFSGSNTVSNLSFGGIQSSIAAALELPRCTILALQSVGGAMGNMTCIHNIVAVCSVLGLSSVEGRILKSTVLPMLLYGVIAALAGKLLLA